MRLALKAFSRPAAMPARCLAGRALGAFGEPIQYDWDGGSYTTPASTTASTPASTPASDGGGTPYYLQDPNAGGGSSGEVPYYLQNPDGSTPYDWSDGSGYPATTSEDGNPYFLDNPSTNSNPSGGSTPSTSDQFLDYLKQFGKDAANSALKYGIQYGTKAATDYVNCLAQGGNADRCAGIIQQASKSGAQTVTKDALKAQIINLNNEIEKLKASLLAATTPESKMLIQNTLNSLQTQLNLAINQLAGMGEASPVQTQPYQQQPGMDFLTVQQQGWLTTALVPVGGLGLGALAGYYYAKKPMHALIGAGVGGIVAYLLTKVVGR